MHQHIKNVEKLSTADMNQLKNVNSKDGKSIYDKLIKKHEVKSLVTNGNKVNNKKVTIRLLRYLQINLCLKK